MPVLPPTEESTCANKVVGIFTDGDIKRTIQNNRQIKGLMIKSLMTRNPISINKDVLAVKAVELMNRKKVTSLCVHKNKDKRKTIGILHIHNLTSSQII